MVWPSWSILLSNDLDVGFHEDLLIQELVSDDISFDTLQSQENINDDENSLRKSTEGEVNIVSDDGQSVI